MNIDKDRFGHGTPKSLLRGDEMQIPIIGEWLEKKLLSEDESNFYKIQREIGEDNMMKLISVFSKENPDIKLAEMNEKIYDWMIKPQAEANNGTR